MPTNKKNILLQLSLGHPALMNEKEFNDLCRILIIPIGELNLYLKVEEPDWERIRGWQKEGDLFYSGKYEIKILTIFGNVYLKCL